ncbi:alpha amylase 3 (IC) [Corchorus olitorius]|uniref:Alpha amylase 3 (IC) n=1 Tax=Corchorus olitorius TaxID=93759 RepID=A0A1R3IW18_9ROSI|nr:alpha amylase 3 (IC) [Corchorus olitorius]
MRSRVIKNKIKEGRRRGDRLLANAIEVGSEPGIKLDLRVPNWSPLYNSKVGPLALVTKQLIMDCAYLAIHSRAPFAQIFLPDPCFDILPLGLRGRNLPSKKISKLNDEPGIRVTTLRVSKLWGCKIPTSGEDVGMAFLGVDEEGSSIYVHIK